MNDELATSILDDAQLAAGKETFLRVMGSAPERFSQQVNTLAPGYGDMILSWEFGDAYNRPGLDLKTRELIIIAACAAIGVTGHGAVAMHVQAALRAGATPAEIKETLVQVGFAAGLPAALGALQIASDALQAPRDAG